MSSAYAYTRNANIKPVVDMMEESNNQCQRSVVHTSGFAKVRFGAIAKFVIVLKAIFMKNADGLVTKRISTSSVSAKPPKLSTISKFFLYFMNFQTFSEA